jgi:hypothetical protein
MLIRIDHRTQFAVQPGDISAMRIRTDALGPSSLVLQMIGGQEIVIPSKNDAGAIDLSAVFERLLEASK